jgi:hypothetical protein
MKQTAPDETNMKEQRKEDYREARKRTNAQQRLQRQHDKIEKQIHELESVLGRLNEEINTASENGDMDKLESLGNDYKEKDTTLRKLWNEWETIGAELE